jgi:hypothetical protein
MGIEAQIRQAIRDAVNRNSRKPFFWGGLRGYQQLESIEKALEQLQEEGGESNYLRLLNQRVQKILVNNSLVAQDLKAAYQLLNGIANCLGYPPASGDRESSACIEKQNSQGVATKMEVLLGQFHPSGKLCQAQRGLWSAAKKRWGLYGQELLHCYDISGLPQDNLQLESLFGSLRRHQRRISGRKSTPELHDFGQVQVLFRAESEADLLRLIQQVSHLDFLVHRQRLMQIETSHQFTHNLHHDPLKTIQRLLHQHGSRQKFLTHLKTPACQNQGFHIN